MIAFDACIPVSRFIGGFPAAGIEEVGRYIAPGSANAWKVLSRTEAVELAIAGIKVFPIFETNGRPNGASVGNADGKFAAGYLPMVGFAPNSGVCIYYTEDKDTKPPEMPGVIEAFSAFRSHLSPAYEIGSYGGGYCNAQLWQRKLIEKRWLTCSTGFNGTHEAIAAGDYEMIQRVPANVRLNNAVINVDPDSLHESYTDIGARVPWNGAVPHGATLSACSLQLLLKKTGADVTVDDVSGAGTKAAIKAFLDKYHYTSLEWTTSIPQLLSDAGVKVAA